MITLTLIILRKGDIYTQRVVLTLHNIEKIFDIYVQYWDNDDLWYTEILKSLIELDQSFFSTAGTFFIFKYLGTFSSKLPR